MVFRHVLRSWLIGAAKRKARQKAVEAAREHLQNAAEKPSGGRSGRRLPPCQLGVVFALGIEAGGLEDLLEAVITTRGDGLVVHQGQLRGRDLTLIRSGTGRRRAAKATDALIRGHRPERVLAAGLAGGLSPEVKRHDILVVDRVADTAGNELAIDPQFDPAGLGAAPGVHVGRLLTADRIIRRPSEKRSLFRQYDALAVDMESYAVAEVCRRHGVPFLAVRAISDAVDDELPREVRKLLAQSTTAAQLGAAASSLWKRPSSLKDIYKLKENALLASDRLAKFLAGRISRLAPRP